MSTLPPSIQIDLVAVAKGWNLMVRRVTEYMDGMMEIMRNWLPAVTAAKRYEINRMHKLYRRRQLARRRRNRRR